MMLAAGAGACPDGQTVTSLTRHIFDDLTHDEIVTVINYTRQIACFNQPGDTAATHDGNVTTLAVIELRPPKKHAAVNYLDGGGPAPDRNARVVLYRPVYTSCYIWLYDYTYRVIR